MWSKRLPVELEGVEWYFFTILEPQSTGAIRATEAADGGGMQGILYAEYHDLRPPGICPLHGTRYSSALRTDEVATNVAFAGECSGIRQVGSPEDRGVVQDTLSHSNQSPVMSISSSLGHRYHSRSGQATAPSDTNTPPVPGIEPATI